eukprot:5749902-Prymnesium_polylepis.1
MHVGCLEGPDGWKLPGHWDGGSLELRSVCIVLVTHALVVDPSHLMAASHGHGPRQSTRSVPPRHRLRVWPL